MGGATRHPTGLNGWPFAALVSFASDLVNFVRCRWVVGLAVIVPCVDRGPFLHLFRCCARGFGRLGIVQVIWSLG